LLLPLKESPLHLRPKTIVVSPLRDRDRKQSDFFTPDAKLPLKRGKHRPSLPKVSSQDSSVRPRARCRFQGLQECASARLEIQCLLAFRNECDGDEIPQSSPPPFRAYPAAGSCLLARPRIVRSNFKTRSYPTSFLQLVGLTPQPHTPRRDRCCLVLPA